MFPVSFNNGCCPFVQVRSTVADVFDGECGFQGVVTRFCALTDSSNFHRFIQFYLFDRHSVFLGCHRQRSRESCPGDGRECTGVDDES